jgi:hypothetical protein
VTTRIISLHDLGDEPLPPPRPLPLTGGPPAKVPSPLGGALVFHDGSVIVITKTTVLGRDPESDPRVAEGTIHGAVLTGADLVVSRIHAELQVSEAAVALVDRQSSNGTLTRRSSDQPWQRLQPGIPALLQPGDEVSFGGLTCRFDALHDLPA